MEIRIKEGEKTYRLKIEHKNNSFFVSSSDFETSALIENLTPNSFLLRIGEKILTVYYAIDGSRLHIFINGKNYTIEKEEGKRAEIYHEEKGEKVVTSPLPGTVSKIHVKEGDEIEKNQPLLVIESMKMEIEVKSPRNGIVKKILTKNGSYIDVGEPIVLLSWFIL